MNDLISRQAAIDAIVNTVSRIGLHDNSEVARYGVTFRQREIIDIIESLPSAQPEIVRCCQCKYAEVADKEDAQDGYTCQFHRGSVWFSGSYCSWAERRQDDY